jgi:hypothetical protein
MAGETAVESLIRHMNYRVHCYSYGFDTVQLRYYDSEANTKEHKGETEIIHACVLCMCIHRVVVTL